MRGRWSTFYGVQRVATINSLKWRLKLSEKPMMTPSRIRYGKSTVSFMISRWTDSEAGFPVISFWNWKEVSFFIQLIDYLMGETDGAPKDAKYLFRLYMALHQVWTALSLHSIRLGTQSLLIHFDQCPAVITDPIHFSTPALHHHVSLSDILLPKQAAA